MNESKGYLNFNDIVNLNIYGADWLGTIKSSEYKPEYNEFKNELERKAKLIHNELVKGSSNDTHFLNEIKENTYFERGFDDWNITNYVRKHTINSKDVFLALTLNAKPTGMGMIEYIENLDKVSDNKIGFWNDYYNNELAETLRRNPNSEYLYFDYANGIRLKMGFPICPMKGETIIPIYKYDGIIGFPNKILHITKFLLKNYKR